MITTRLLRKDFLISAGFLSLVLFASATDSKAAIYTWEGTTPIVSPTTDSDWNTALNWNPGVGYPSTNSDTALFDATSGLLNPNLSTSETIQLLNFSSASTPGYTFDTTGSKTLTLDSNTATNNASVITDSSTSLETFNLSVTATDSASANNGVFFTIGSGGVTFTSGHTLTATVGTGNLYFSETGGTASLNGAIAFTAAGGTLNFDGTGTYNFNPTSVTGSPNIRLSNAGTVNLQATPSTGIGYFATGGTSGASDFGTIYMVTSGETLSQVMNLGTLGATSGSDVFGSNVSGTGSTTASANVKLGGGTQTHSLYAAANNTLNITGNVSNGATTGALDITGTGVVVFSNTSNNYVSPTTIASGATLKVTNTSGSATGTGSVTDNGILGGTGIISTTGVTTGGATAISIASGATLSPSLGSGTGFSHLTLNLTSGTVMTTNTGTLYNFNLGAATASSDEVLVTGGGLTLGTTTISKFTFNAEGTFTTGTYLLIDDAAGITGSASGTAILDGYSATLSNTGTDVELVVSAVPEPSSVALMGLGLLALLAFGYRNRNRTAGWVG